MSRCLPAASEDVPDLKRKGVFLSLEGGDGSGKSVTAAKIVEALVQNGVPSLLLRPKRPTFTDSYVAHHMQTLASILWESDAIQPRHTLGDDHWAHLASAWFRVVDHHIVRPALDSGYVLVADSWFHKLLARFELKGPAMAEKARCCFDGLSRPARVCLLDLAPEVAAARKTSFGYAESGNFDGLCGVTRENFVRYQTQVRERLLRLARAEGWIRIDVACLGSGEVTQQVLDAFQSAIHPCSLELPEQIDCKTN